jgi:4'-phosphopantetheinyl transferase
MTILDTVRDCLKFTSVGAIETALPASVTFIPITGNQLHLWSARYSDLDRHYPVLSNLISAQEAARAAGFKRTLDAKNYILRHGLVRVVLGQYIQRVPLAVRFVHNENGKPDLDPESDIHDIHFSLSRTDQMVCLGISRKNRIGLDIVKSDSGYPFSATAQYLFTPAENQWITRTPYHEQYIRFFRIWSLKEALLKATGGGVNMMKETEVSGIMINHSLDGFYPVTIGNKEMVIFIHESPCGKGHHCTLVTIPAIITRPLN